MVIDVLQKNELDFKLAGIMYWFKDKATLSFLFEKAMIYMYITYIKCGKTIEVGGLGWYIRGTLLALFSNRKLLGLSMKLLKNWPFFISKYL